MRGARRSSRPLSHRSRMVRPASPEPRSTMRQGLSSQGAGRSAVKPACSRYADEPQEEIDAGRHQERLDPPSPTVPTTPDHAWPIRPRWSSRAVSTCRTKAHTRRGTLESTLPQDVEPRRRLHWRHEAVVREGPRGSSRHCGAELRDGHRTDIRSPYDEETATLRIAETTINRIAANEVATKSADS